MHVKCELADTACYRTHAWCKDCWMTELFDFCPVEKKKKKSGITHCCSLCGKLYADRDKMGAILCCEGDDACDTYHVWCKDCWMKNFNLSFCPLARKKKKLYKYYKKTHVNLIEVICADLCKKCCTGCFFIGSPPLSHSCLLHRDDKIKKYVRVAIQIIRNCGVACIELRKMLEEIKGKIVFSDCEITAILEHQMTYAELKDEIELTYV